MVEAGANTRGDEGPPPRDSAAPMVVEPGPVVGGAAGSGGTAMADAAATTGPRQADAAAVVGDVAAPPAVVSAACGKIPGALYCDDFESGLNPALTPKMSMGGTITVDETRAHSGKGALHVKSLVTAYADGEVDLGKTVFPTANNSFFLRAFIYYTPPAPPDNVYLFRVRGYMPNTKSYIEGQIGVIGDPYNQPTAANFKNLSHTIYHSAIKSADHVSYQTAAAPEVKYGTWVCWEWEVDGVNNKWRLWVDGVEHFSRTWDGQAGTAWVVPSATAFTIGVKHDHDEKGGIEVWYDDLVIASKRVGCAAP